MKILTGTAIGNTKGDEGRGGGSKAKLFIGMYYEGELEFPEG